MTLNRALHYSTIGTTLNLSRYEQSIDHDVEYLRAKLAASETENANLREKIQKLQTSLLNYALVTGSQQVAVKNELKAPQIFLGGQQPPQVRAI